MESFYKLDNGNTVIGSNELTPNTFYCTLYDNNNCILIKDKNNSKVYYNDYVDDLKDINNIPYNPNNIEDVYINNMVY